MKTKIIAACILASAGIAIAETATVTRKVVIVTNVVENFRTWDESVYEWPPKLDTRVVECLGGAHAVAVCHSVTHTDYLTKIITGNITREERLQFGFEGMWYRFTNSTVLTNWVRTLKADVTSKTNWVEIPPESPFKSNFIYTVPGGGNPIFLTNGVSNVVIEITNNSHQYTIPLGELRWTNEIRR